MDIVQVEDLQIQANQAIKLKDQVDEYVLYCPLWCR
jgi:hypothetical protein